MRIGPPVWSVAALSLRDAALGTEHRSADD